MYNKSDNKNFKEKSSGGFKRPEKRDEFIGQSRRDFGTKPNESRSFKDNKDDDSRSSNRRDYGNKPNGNKSFNDNRNSNDNKNFNESKSFNDNRDNDFDDDIKNVLIIGRNPVIEALKAERLIDTIYVNSEGGGSLSHIISMAKEQNIVIKNVSEAKLSSMSNNASHQGIIAVGACAEYVTVEEILQISRDKNEEPFIIICDEIEDPHNLGAIIRTAESAGAHGIIIPKRRSASLNHTVFKTSAGAASWLPVARVSNIVAAIETLKKNGVWIYGTDSEGEDYTKTDLSGSIGLVIGSEGNGIGRLVKEKCDYLLKLPMLGKITSLNASVAGGIFMYEIVRQKLNSKK